MDEDDDWLLANLLENEMSFYNYRKYSSRGEEVATAILEAYADGISIADLIKKDKLVRGYWEQVAATRVARLANEEKERIRLAKLAEKRKIAAAKKAEVMAKLTTEELEAFGLVKKKTTRVKR